jgi:hypothetical protein
VTVPTVPACVIKDLGLGLSVALDAGRLWRLPTAVIGEERASLM